MAKMVSHQLDTVHRGNRTSDHRMAILRARLTKMRRVLTDNPLFIIISAMAFSGVYLWHNTSKLEELLQDQVRPDEYQIQSNEIVESTHFDSQPIVPELSTTAEPIEEIKDSSRLKLTAPELKPKRIEPFEEIQVRRSTTPERTLRWLDLWGDDPNCTKFDVNLLEEKSIEPRALVSFPGSGNTWLRMLLMGITGVYINSVYGGEDALFDSKGKLDLFLV